MLAVASGGVPGAGEDGLSYRLLDRQFREARGGHRGGNCLHGHSNGHDSRSRRDRCRVRDGGVLGSENVISSETPTEGLPAAVEMKLDSLDRGALTGGPSVMDAPRV